jgi:Ca-activated chloride channel family protein
MRRYLPVLAVLLACGGMVRAHGLLIPEDKTLPPLAMLNHKVTITIDDQVAVTNVEQTFRNHTDRQLEATYLFPVPKGASVNRFTMFVNGRETKGELIEAGKARQIYTSIVRRTQDPGLLEYVGNNLFRMRVFPIPPKGDQKVTLRYTAVSERQGDLVEYVYPLKTDGKATSTLEGFSITATIQSQHGVQNVYSPTHAIALARANDKEVKVTFEKNQALLDKDFQLFYQLGDRDVGLTALTYRPISAENGYVMLLLTPKVELSKSYEVPRDMVLVLDTSGSMQGAKMEQARKALKFCLENLRPQDRFGLLNFATTVTRYRDTLLDASSEQLAQASKWVDGLEATGGTAIDDALASALALRPGDDSRTFTIVFFTDGQPTIGETNPETILKNVAAKNTASTRIFTFGVGDDVNATMLDQLAEQTRAVATYVRPQEDISAKVAGLYAKISHPVLTNLKLTATNDVRFTEVYPPKLPDLFHGQQLVVLGRYAGKGPAAVRLTGSVGKESKEFAYDLTFPEKTGDGKAFVEEIWARRKVGYLLDQIRRNGEKKELVDEVVALAKKYGITTPYTSYLIVPDGPLPVAGRALGGAPNVFYGQFGPGGGMYGPGYGGGMGMRGGGGFGGPIAPPGGGSGSFVPPALNKPASGAGAATAAPLPVSKFAKDVTQRSGSLQQNRERLTDEALKRGEKEAKGQALRLLEDAKQKKAAYDQARDALAARRVADVQAGQLGVDLSVQMNNLRNQSRLEYRASRNVAGRNCLEIGGVWIDEKYDSKMPEVTVKAMSDAYFRILERHGEVKPVFQLGNYLVWVTPSGTALIIDAAHGKEKLSDADIDKLFAAGAKAGKP